MDREEAIVYLKEGKRALEFGKLCSPNTDLYSKRIEALEFAIKELEK